MTAVEPETTFAELQAVVTRLLANQRDPQCVQIRRRKAWVFGVAYFMLGALCVVTVVNGGPIGTHPASTPVVMTDRQFADQWNRITAGVPGTQPITAGQASAVAEYACKPGSLDAVLLPPKTWHRVQALVASSGRCPR